MQSERALHPAHPESLAFIRINCLNKKSGTQAFSGTHASFVTRLIRRQGSNSLPHDRFKLDCLTGCAVSWCNCRAPGLECKPIFHISTRMFSSFHVCPNLIFAAARDIRHFLNTCQVVSVECLLRLDASSSTFKLDKSVLREVQIAYCNSLASSCVSVADLAKFTLPRCYAKIRLWSIRFMIHLKIRACPTSVASADSILCGGFHSGQITELIGDSAVGSEFFLGCWNRELIQFKGKTQLLMQVAAKCCISNSRDHFDALVAVCFHQFIIMCNWNFMCSGRLRFCTFTMAISYAPQGVMQTR